MHAAADRLHPGSKTLLLAAALVVTLALPLAPLFVAAALAAGAGLALARARMARALAWTLPFALLNALILGLVWGGPTLLASLGPFRLTAEGLLEGAAVSARAFLAFLAAWAFREATPPAQVVSALHRFPRLAVAWGGTLRFLPLLESDLRALREAQRVRGRALRAGLRGALDAAPLAAPLLVRTVRRGHHLQDALTVAAFDPARPRARYSRLPWRAADTWLALAAPALATAILLLTW